MRICSLIDMKQPKKRIVQNKNAHFVNTLFFYYRTNETQIKCLRTEL